MLQSNTHVARFASEAALDPPGEHLHKLVPTGRHAVERDNQTSDASSRQSDRPTPQSTDSSLSDKLFSLLGELRFVYYVQFVEVGANDPGRQTHHRQVSRFKVTALSRERDQDEFGVADREGGTWI